MTDTDKENKSDGSDIAMELVVGGGSPRPVISQIDSTVSKSLDTSLDENIDDTEDENIDDTEDEIDEEYIRLVTKDGVEYLLGAPLPPSKGFIIAEDGSPLTWNPNSLRMEKYVPEQVRIRRINLFHLRGSDDVFRIFCLADKDSEYKQQGLAVVRTIPFSEISSWDTIVEESILLQDIDYEGENNG